MNGKINGLVMRDQVQHGLKIEVMELLKYLSLAHKELRYNINRKEKFAGSTPASHQRVADSGKDKDTSFLVQRLVVDPAGERRV